jgi:competence protein ComEC
MKSRLLVLMMVAAATGCGGAPEKVSGPEDEFALDEDADAGVAPDEEDEEDEEEVAAEPDADSGEAPAAAEDEVLLTLDVIDVGTGLSMFLRGADFTMLFDAGSKEDVADKKKNRVVAFLKERHPDVKVIDHVVLSHAHRDHVNLMADVLRRYEVRHVWEPGVVHQTCPYRGFIEAVAREEGVAYHTGLNRKGSHKIRFDAVECKGAKQAKLEKKKIEIEHASRLKVDRVVRLGKRVKMKFLYLYTEDEGYPNRNSLVVRVDAGSKRILLTGDTVAGRRGAPSVPPDKKSAERELVKCCSDELAADVLQVGHHGADNASSTKFLDAVGAEIFIMTVGKGSFHGYVVPHPDVIEELESRGVLLRTDARDGVCADSELKVGPKADGVLGGCDNYRVSIFRDKDTPPKIEVYPEQL